MSNPITTDIEVSVKTTYLPEQSDTGDKRFAFAYTITISNRGMEPMQLLHRRWLITDARNRQQEVSGEGVVGQQPQIDPGQSFTYTSGAILETNTGIMEGFYEMTDSNGKLFDVAIPPFALVPPDLLH